MKRLPYQPGMAALSGRAAGILTVDKEKDRARTNGASHHFNSPGYEKTFITRRCG